MFDPFTLSIFQIGRWLFARHRHCLPCPTYLLPGPEPPKGPFILTTTSSLIPDGAITAAHFVRTPYYVQIHGFWDGTQMNIVSTTSASCSRICADHAQPEGDSGGELDPHGPDAVGNPIGGNVTSDVSGEDVFYEEVSINDSRPGLGWPADPT